MVLLCVVRAGSAEELRRRFRIEMLIVYHAGRGEKPP